MTLQQIEEPKPEEESILIKWRPERGEGKIDFTRPITVFTKGTRGSAKSSLLVTMAIEHAKKGFSILDLFGSRDDESLAWLRSDFAKTKKILLVTGENVEIEAPCDYKPLNKIIPQDLENYDVIISAPSLYISPSQEFRTLGIFMDALYRFPMFNRKVVMVCREASNFLYARLMINENQTQAKAMTAYLMREARHIGPGIALLLDSQRYFSVDIDVRNLTDFMILKQQGIDGLDKDLHWVYSLYKPNMFQRMPKNNFVIVQKEGPVGIGDFIKPTWVKEEGEDIKANVGVKILKKGEEIQEAESRGKFSTVGDKEHVEIIRSYIEDKFGEVKLGVKFHRSSSTIFNHIKLHNKNVRDEGCHICKRVGSKHDKTLAEHNPVAMD